MTWENLWNIAKMLGAVTGLAALVTLIARIWTSAIRERLIETLQDDLKLAREHSEHGDKLRHDLRAELQGQLSKVEAELLFARGKMKDVEVENARLLAKTDLSPVMQSLTSFIEEQRNFTKEQTEINARVLKALEQLITRVAKT